MCNLNGMNWFRLCCISLLASCLSGCSSLGLTLWPSQFPLLKTTKEIAATSPRTNGLPNELDKRVLEEYFLEPGDRVLLEPVSFDFDFAASGDQEVQVDGSIDLGKYGRLRVAGQTVEGVEGLIDSRIEAETGTKEHVNVRLLEANASQIYVLGQVGAPGTYPLLGREHVLEAILEAGGLTSEASPCDIILVRPTLNTKCRVVLPVCYRQITQLGDASTNYQLQPGDRIVVGTRTLCEELAVWKQTSSCECCSQSCGSEKTPQRADYRNHLLRALAAAPFPWKRSQSQHETEPESSDEEQVTVPSTAPPQNPGKSAPEPASIQPTPPSAQPNLQPADNITFEEPSLYLPPLRAAEPARSAPELNDK